MIYEITPDGRSCFKCANEAAADSADMVAVAGGVVGVCMMWYVACGVLVVSRHFVPHRGLVLDVMTDRTISLSTSCPSTASLSVVISVCRPPSSVGRRASCRRNRNRNHYHRLPLSTTTPKTRTMAIGYDNCRRSSV